MYIQPIELLKCIIQFGRVQVLQGYSYSKKVSVCQNNKAKERISLITIRKNGDWRELSGPREL